MGQPVSTPYTKTITIGGKDSSIEQVVFPQIASPTTDTTNTTFTIPTASLLSGFFIRNPAGVSTDTTDTAANIVAAMGTYVKAGQAFEFNIRNISANVITIAAGSGVTLAAGNTNTVIANSTKRFLMTIDVGTDGTPACTLYAMQTSTH
jgi:hypothetical protein